MNFCAIYLLNKMIILVSIHPLLKFLFTNDYKDSILCPCMLSLVSVL